VGCHSIRLGSARNFFDAAGSLALLSSKSSSEAANSYFFIHIALHGCLLFVALASARNCSPTLKCTKFDGGTQLNCSVVCIFLVHVALQDFQFVLASAQARNYAPMHQLDRDTQLNFSAVCSFVPCCRGRDGETPEGGMLVSGWSAVAFRAFRQDDSLS